MHVSVETTDPRIAAALGRGCRLELPDDGSPDEHLVAVRRRVDQICGFAVAVSRLENRAYRVTDWKAAIQSAVHRKRTK